MQIGQAVSILHNKTVQSVSGWIGALTGVFTFLGWLTPKWVGELTWPYLVLGGFLAAVITSFILSLALLALALASRYFRRPEAVLSLPQVPEAAVIQSYDDSKLRAEFASLKSSYLAAIEDYQRLSALEPKLDTLMRDFEGLPEKAENTRARTEHAHTLIEQLAAQIEKEKNRRALSFYGFRTERTLDDLDSRLESGAEALYHRVQAGECLDQAEWAMWEDLFRRWRGDLKAWVTSAKWCAYNVERRTLHVAPEDFDGEWTIRDDQFPTADAQRKFKFQRLLLRNWNDVREDVRDGLQMMTYLGMGDKDVQRASAAKLGIHTL